VTVPTAAYRARQSEAVIVVRMLPPVEISPNAHVSWRKKAAAAAEFQAQARWATRVTSDSDSFSGKRDPVRMDFEIAWCGRRQAMDDDNAKACMKPIIDGIAAELWGGQDRHVTIGEVTQSRGEGLVRVTLRGEG
jgi:hypothetical protein